MSEPLVRYIVGLVVCVVVAVAYAATRKHGLRAIVLDSLLCLAAMLGVIAGVAAVVLVLSALK